MIHTNFQEFLSFIKGQNEVTYKQGKFYAKFVLTFKQAI